VDYNGKVRFPYSAVTPKHVYQNRRRFLTTLAGGAAALTLPSASLPAGPKLAGVIKTPYGADEKPTPASVITGYNNFYEFGTAKDEPAQNARSFVTSPWRITIEGEVAKPVTLDLDTIMRLAPLEERIYRHRCVEGWSIVVPWIGYSLNALLKQVEPTGKAKFVAFQSYYDRKQMPDAGGIRFPYLEGLRLDEAMNPLTLLCVGLYGETLPNQNGAPVRIVVPWKYGFKSIKSVVKIKLQDQMPPTTWNRESPSAYGFYSNVNPRVDPWRSQTEERRLGEFGKRQTVLFNGYIKEVASMYAGMDLKKNY
jgi:methionine sulfoxide reductase catalytic subunit